MKLHNYNFGTNTDCFIQQGAFSPVMCAISSGLVKENSDLTENKLPGHVSKSHFYV